MFDLFFLIEILALAFSENFYFILKTNDQYTATSPSQRGELSPERKHFFGLGSSNLSQLPNNFSMLIKLSIQVVLLMQVMSYLRHEVRRLLGVWSSIHKCLSGLCLGSSTPAQFEESTFCLKSFLLHIYLLKFISHIIQLWNMQSTWGRKKQTKKPHSIILRYLETPSYSSQSQFAFFWKVCDTH